MSEIDEILNSVGPQSMFHHKISLLIQAIRALAAKVEALEKQFVVSGRLGAVPPLAPKGQDEKMPTVETGHHTAQTLVDCAAHARELSIAIEDLPASGQQTVCSIQAASLSQKLHALLRQAPALPGMGMNYRCDGSSAQWRDAAKEKPEHALPVEVAWKDDISRLMLIWTGGKWCNQAWVKAALNRQPDYWRQHLPLPPMPKEAK